MDPLLKDLITIGFSSGALVISVVSLNMTILNYRRQGSLVKMHLEYDRKGLNGTFLLKVENEGYHSVKINSVRLVLAGRTVPVDQLGFELNYGQEHTVRIPLAGLSDVHPLEIIRVEALDIADNIYKITTKHLQQKIRQ